MPDKSFEYKELDSIWAEHLNDNLRQVLRYAYVYGCYGKDDILKKSNTKKDSLNRLVLDAKRIIPESFFETSRRGKEEVFSCNYEATESSNNFLNDIFTLAKINPVDMCSQLRILSELSNGEEKKADGIFASSDKFPEDERKRTSILNEGLDGSKKTRIFTSMINAGVICQGQKNGRYVLPKDPLDSFSIEELSAVFTYLEFKKNKELLSVPYSLLQQKLALYIHSKTDRLPEKQSPFAFKHVSFQNAIDNEIILTFLRAIENKRKLDMISNKVQTDGTIRNSGEVIIPIKVLYDVQYGRVFLVFEDTSRRRKDWLRVKQAHEVEGFSDAGELDENDLRKVEKAKEFADYGWTIPTQGQQKNVVTIEFEFDKLHEAEQYNRLIGEGHNALIEKTGSGCYSFSFHLDNTSEIVPWVRSFGEYAKATDERVRKEIIADWDNAIMQYSEGDTDEDEEYESLELFSSEKTEKNVDTNSKRAKKEKDQAILFQPYSNRLMAAITYFVNCREPLTRETIQNGWRYFNMPEFLHEFPTSPLNSFFFPELKIEDRGSDIDDAEPYYYLFEYNAKDKNWSYNSKDSILKYRIPVILTGTEKQILGTLSKEEDISCFMSEETIDKLVEICRKEGTLWNPELIEKRNRFAIAETSDRRKNSDIILSSLEFIQRGEAVNCKAVDNTVYREMYPVKLEYDLITRDYTLWLYSEEKDWLEQLPLEKIKQIEGTGVCNKLSYFSFTEKRRKRQKQVSLKLEPVQYTIERCFRQFAGYKRKTAYVPLNSDESGTERYEMTIFYDCDEEENVITGILAMGDGAVVTGPENIKNRVFERVKLAQEKYL